MTPLLLLLPGPLRPGVVVPVRIPSMGHIDLFTNNPYLLEIFDIIRAEILKKLFKERKRERKMNAFPEPLGVKYLWTG